MLTPVAILIAALAVAPADRLAMADRLFNRAEYALARAEYAALSGEKSIAADELLYRLAECDQLTGRKAEAKAGFAKLLSEYPASRHADRARLQLALATSGEERVRELKLLDSDRVAAKLRAEALYRLGEATGDAAWYEKCKEVEPKGAFAEHAIVRRASILAKGNSPEVRRQAVTLLLEVAFGSKDAKLAESALYLASSVSFDARSYGEASTLARRYLKKYSKGQYAQASTELAAWCDYLRGNYADAISMAGEGRSDGTAYVRAAATQASGDDVRARELFVAYLADYPRGRSRKEAELAVARIDGEAAEKSGDHSKAVEAARKAFALSGSAADRLRLAWAYENGKRPDEAQREYLALASQFPGTQEAAQAMYHKALIDLRAQKWSAADLALREALAGKLEARQRPEAEYWRGIAACQAGHAEEGEKSLKAALAAGLSLDQTREARLVIADLDYNAGRTNEAISAYADLVRGGAVVRMSAAKALAVGRLMAPAEMKLCAEHLAKSGSAEWRQYGYALLGDAEEALGNLTAAGSAWEKGVAEKCETEALAGVTLKLGRFRSQNGDRKGAEEMLNRAVELNQRNNELRAAAYLYLAENALAGGNHEAAKGYATVVVTLFEKSAFARQAADILSRPGVK